MTTRRNALRWISGAVLSASLPSGIGLAKEKLLAATEAEKKFELSYILGSSMYGEIDLATILPECKKVGATSIDLWPKPHGNQREQVDAMGLDKFEALLEKHAVKLGMLTHYGLGPFGLAKEWALVKRFGAKIVITGSRGAKKQRGAELKASVKSFVEKMKPHAAAAAEHGATIGIENHSNALIQSYDSIRWLAEFSSDMAMGIALAPYHLPQKPDELAALIRDIGPKLVHFYAWEHGKGCHKKMPKADELMQMPGRGKLDFAPMLRALRAIEYSGWTEIFMHPTPRGIPILENAAAVTEEIRRANRHLASLL